MIFNSNSNFVFMSTGLIAQAHLTFRVKGVDKKIVCNGTMAQAMASIRNHYPYFCCIEGHSKVVKKEDMGSYTITDTLSGQTEFTGSIQ